MSPPKHPLPPTGTPKPPPGKSNFRQTCDRLSLFLKEKGANFKFDATGVSSAKGMTVELLSSIDDEPGEKVEKSAKSRRRPPQSAQMTIFYEGEVLVLDDVPADRARGVMVMAKNGGPRGSKVPPDPAVDVSGDDLPIARRASLHKFLAKRKDRATVRQPHPHPHPYQLQNQSPGGSSSAHEQHTFDLNM